MTEKDKLDTCPNCHGKIYIPKKVTTDNKRPTGTYTFVKCLSCHNGYIIELKN